MVTRTRRPVQKVAWMGSVEGRIETDLKIGNLEMSARPSAFVGRSLEGLWMREAQSILHGHPPRRPSGWRVGEEAEMPSHLPISMGFFPPAPACLFLLRSPPT
jgi:hypothetical protein